MNKDRLMKLGLLKEKQEKLKELEIRADRLIKDINYYLFTTEGIRGLEIDHARQAMEELVRTVDEFRIVQKEIERLEAEV